MDVRQLKESCKASSCDTALYKSIHKRQLVVPRENFLGLKIFRCNYCGKAFGSNSALRIHSLIHTGEKPFVCDICNKAFNQKSNLVKHSAIHVGIKEFSCQYCGKVFTQKDTLRLHIAKFHVLISPSVQVYSDESSNFSITSERYISISHSAKELSPKTFCCDICGKVFTVKTRLKVHRLTHTGEKPFVCQFCGRKFTQKGNLKTHLSLHTGEKKFNCCYCRKSFNRKDSLVLHIHQDHKEISKIG
ncbi:zinc finger protein OZF-like [Uloborus diversus]|uniref:zinc finger protein OZF-like n=1 Tax=Uloborus diversus TaxID=327109 RepID=UPI0024091B81|nr:zinc finger protein OZF-like [Uloborus diversus]